MLYEYQQRFSRDNSRLRIYNKSRQIGLSYYISFEAMLKAKKRDVLLCSASQRQSRELNRKVQKWASIWETAKIIEIDKLSTEEISFKGGGTIFCLPSNPNTVRGFSGDVYLDEFALHKEQNEIYESLLPTILRGGNLTIVSTPLGQSDLFYEIFNDVEKYPDFSRHETTIYDAKQQGFDIDIEFIRRNVDDETFRQEFMCEFIDESTSYFPFALIKSRVGDYSINGRAYNYLGVDIGRKRDLTAIYVLSLFNDKFYVKAWHVVKNMRYREQYDLIKQTIIEHDIIKGGIDATGIGSQLAEDINAEFSFIQPVIFTPQIKERLVTTTKKVFDNGNIVIPEDRDLINDIHAIRKSVTASNNIKYDAEHSETGHADRFWSLAIAIESASYSSIETQVYSAGKSAINQILQGY